MHFHLTENINNHIGLKISDQVASANKQIELHFSEPFSQELLINWSQGGFTDVSSAQGHTGVLSEKPQV